VQVLSLGGIHRLVRHIILDVDAGVLLPDDLFEEGHVDALAPRAFDEARVHGGGDGVRVVRVDARAPEEALGADGGAFGGAEPGSGYADGVGVVDLEGVVEACDQVGSD